MERLDIAEAVAALRSELAEAILASADEQLRFSVGEIELEFQVAVERSVEGGVKFWVIEAGAGAKSTETHTVRVPLTPTLAGGGPVLTGASDEVPERPAG